MPLQTDDLNIVLLDPNQTGTRETVNEGLSGLAKSLSRNHSQDLTGIANPVTLAYEAAEGGDKTGLHVFRYHFTGSPGAARDIIHPPVPHAFYFFNNCDQDLTIKVSGQVGISINPGDARLCYCDGTNIFSLSTATVDAGNAINVVGSVVNVDFMGETEDANPDAAADYVLVWDVSAGVFKKVLIENLPTGTASPTPAPSDEDTASRTIVLADANTFRRANSATDIVYSVPLDATLSMPLDCEIAVHQQGVGRASFSFDPGITLSMPGDRNPACRVSGATIWTKKVGADFWVVSGDLEAA